ncbi:MAG: hypothetical protein AAGA68_25090 [Pseudomonadota bacterium]
MGTEAERFTLALNNLIGSYPDLDGREVQAAMRRVLEAFYTDFEPVYSAEDILRLCGEAIAPRFQNDPPKGA